MFPFINYILGVSCIIIYHQMEVLTSGVKEFDSKAESQII